MEKGYCEYSWSQPAEPHLSCCNLSRCGQLHRCGEQYGRFRHQRRRGTNSERRRRRPCYYHSTCQSNGRPRTTSNLQRGCNRHRPLGLSVEEEYYEYFWRQRRESYIECCNFRRCG